MNNLFGCNGVIVMYGALFICSYISLVYCKFDVLVMFLTALLMFVVSQVLFVGALVVIYVAILIIMLIFVFS